MKFIKKIFPVLAGLCLILISSYSVSSSKGHNNSYAVVIGVREYRDSNWHELRSVENDAKEMAKYFESEGFIVKRFFNKEATRKNILSYLVDELPLKMRAHDRVVIYFSGLGERQKNHTPESYLIPYDGKKTGLHHGFLVES